jgi:hypothetical protein
MTVSFDQLKAQEAMDALDATAALLRARTERRVQLAHKMRSWKGPHADLFWHQHLPGMTDGSAHLIKLLNGLSASIRQASIDAAVDSGALRGPRI